MEAINPSLKITAFLPEIVLFATAIILSLALLSQIKVSQRTIGIIVILGIIASGVLVTQIAPGMAAGDHFLNDSGSRVFKFFFLAAALMFSFLVLINDSFEDRFRMNANILVLLSTLGMMLLSMSMSLLSLFISLELCTIPLIVLLAVDRTESGDYKSLTKFLVMAMLSSLLILFGLTFLFGLSGALNLIVMKLQIAIIHITNQQIGVTILLSIATILLGIVIRAGLFPFHRWAESFQTQLPLPLFIFVSAAFGAAMVVFFAKIFLNGLFAFYGPEMNPNDWGRLVGFLAFVNVVFGTIQLFRQTKMTSFLFYLNIIQFGFVLTGLVSMMPLGIQASGFYLFSFLIAAFGAVFIIQLLSKSLASEEIESYRGISSISPIITAAFSICLLSLAGLPLLSGFVAKYSVIKAAIDRGGTERAYNWQYLLAGAAVISSIFVFIRIIRLVVSFYRKVELPLEPPRISISSTIAIVSIAAAILYFGILPDWLLSFVSGIPQAFGFSVE